MKFFKKIFLLIFANLLLVNISYAISLSTSTNLDILYVNVFHNNKWSGWNNYAEVSKGDKVWFQIHAYANGGDVSGLISKLENINKKSYPKGTTKQVTAFVDSSNTARLNDSVTLTFKDNIKLEYAGYKWATKLKGPNPEANEHVKNLPNGQSGFTALSAAGVQLGVLPKDHRSNLLLFFTTGDYRPPINGVCIEKKNICASGKFVDVKDDTKYYKWKCVGLYGGNGENCFLEKTPKDAVCSPYVNKCRAGYFTDIKNDEKYYIWKCNGLNGGKSLTCKTEKKPISGKCGKSLNKCTRGVFSDVKDTYEKKLWNCKGLYGGKDTSCSIQKMCPCKLEQNVDNGQNLNNSDRNNSNIDCVSGSGGNLIDSDILEENKSLKEELKKLSIKKNTPQKIPSLFYLIALLIYTLIIILITRSLTKKS